MTEFVQIIEWQSSRIDDIRALSDEFRSRREASDDGPRRVTVLADRDRPGTYLTLVHFASAEAAKANSDKPDTSAFAQRMAELCDGPPTFRNTDVYDDEVVG
jgi:quinol monooxygenase YgiN